MSSILSNSSSNISHRIYGDECMLPEKDLISLEKDSSKKKEFTSKFSENYSGQIHQEQHSSVSNNVLKCPNNFNYSNMNSNGAYSTNTHRDSFNDKNNANVEFNQVFHPKTTMNSSNNLSENFNNNHHHDLPVIHAYANNLTNFMSKNHANNITNIKSNSNNIHHDRQYNSHLIERASNYSNSIGLDNTNQIHSSNEQNVNHSLLKRDTEIER
jgi:hypothetical protein